MLLLSGLLHVFLPLLSFHQRILLHLCLNVCLLIALVHCVISTHRFQNYRVHNLVIPIATLFVFNMRFDLNGLELNFVVCDPLQLVFDPCCLELL